MFARSLVAAALALSLTSSASASLITNGSFETGTDPGMFATLGTGSTTITGWTVSSGTIDYVGTYWQASDGTRSVDLGGLEPGAISQTFATQVGGTYEVTFDLSGNPDSGPATKTLIASAGSSSNPFSYTTGANSRSNMMYAPQSFQFVATSALTTLTFTSTTTGGTPNGAFGPVIDNVSVTAVPEPATLAVLGLGLTGLCGYARRRKAAAVA